MLVLFIWIIKSVQIGVMVLGFVKMKITSICNGVAVMYDSLKKIL